MKKRIKIPLLLLIITINVIVYMNIKIEDDELFKALIAIYDGIFLFLL